MRTLYGAVLTVAVALAGLAGPAAGADDELAKQKKAAMDNWALLEAGEPAFHETEHLLLFGPKSQKKQLREWGPLLEKYHALAEKALQVKPKEDLWPGKLAVFVFAERGPYTAFIRRVEKRRLIADEVGSHAVEGDTPHVAAAPPRSKLDPAAERQAGEQVAAALLQKKAGPKTPLPGWLAEGFGRATTWEVFKDDKDVKAERRLAFTLATVKPKRKASDVYAGSLEVDEAVPLRASLADFFAYGPGAARFVRLVESFRPEENMDRKTTEQALTAIAVKPDFLDKRWKQWLTTGK